MKSNKIITTFLLTASIMAQAGSNNAPQLGKSPVKDVVGAMTREEKARFVIGTGMEGIDNGQKAVIGSTKLIVPGAAGTTYPIPRLGIPALVFADGPVGVRIDSHRANDTMTYYGTQFVMPTLIGASWNREVASAVGRAIGQEAADYGVDIMLAPALNIQRHPLCGRNYEYYSEDPLVSGEMATAYVNAMQECGVGACVKHLAANNQETNRKDNESIVSQRALREIYLKGFRNVITNSDPWCVMSSYNYLNGHYTSESPELLDSLLRGEWGYRGVVVSDWFGGNDAVKQMTARNNLLQPGWPGEYDQLVKAMETGTLDESVMDRNIEEVLELILRTPRFRGKSHSDRPDLKGHAALARKIAPEGMVLLKNDNASLPYGENIRNIALFGNCSYDIISGGSGSADVGNAYCVSIPEGLVNAGFHPDGRLRDKYTAHIMSEKERIKKTDRTFHMAAGMRPEEMAVSYADIVKCAERNDAAVITIGFAAGEFADRSTKSFSLDNTTRKMLENVCKAFHSKGKRVTVLLNVGGVIETASWRDMPDAILCTWQCGQEGGNSIADVLSGKAYPSGKLPMTFPVDYADHASDRNFPHDADTGIIFGANKKSATREQPNIDHTIYEEDIYVGYRYFDTFDIPVAYPFGYGLGYTTFGYSEPSISFDGSHYIVEMTVTNTGHRTGKETVQVYVSKPGANVPVRELAGFAKTQELQPGESQRLAIIINPDDLAVFDESASAWITNAGEYKFSVGASSRDIRGTVSCQIPYGIRTVKDILKPSLSINRLSR